MFEFSKKVGLIEKSLNEFENLFERKFQTKCYIWISHIWLVLLFHALSFVILEFSGKLTPSEILKESEIPT